MVQEASIRAYQSLSRFRSESPFRPWLLKIVTNEAQNKRTSSQRRGVREALWGQASRNANAFNIEHLALASERRRYLLSALSNLSQRDQVLISYRYLLDLSESEIAAIIGRPRGTVKSRLSRALDRLRSSLTPQQFEVLSKECLNEY